MEVVAGAMGPLLSKLGELLLDEFNLEKRVRKSVKSLETELALMHATLLKVGEVPPDQLDMDVRVWAGKVRDLSYDMEDIVDTFMVQVENGRENEQPTNMKNRVKKLLKKTIKLFSKGKALHQISDAIQEAQDLAKELSDQRKRYKLMIHSNNTGANIDPRLLDMYKDVTGLIGIEKERDKLIQSLTEDDYKSKQNLKTISIVGFGGLGKTTLAKAVYNKIKVEFDCGAFVSVSRTPDVKRILKDILYDLDKDKFQNIHSTTRGENLLIDELREFLEDKRYLIIIDDIWDVKTWGIIKCALCGNSLGSRIITTTRNVNVSDACHSSGDDIIHRMKPLSMEESQRLFYRRIFPSETGCPHELQEVSKGILKKCGGVPLAIITVASLLSSNQNRMSKDHWCHVLKSIGRGITEDAIVEDMKRILSFSYYDLPFHLKTCLLYLSIFPEDYKIERHRLIWRWIAEGFIHHGKQGKGLFEVGESYFNELVNRSMIQPAYMNYKGKAYFCRVHDMVLDLICSLSREENFVAIWDANGQSIHESQSNFRRLSLQNIGMAELGTPQLGTMNMSQVRSFSLFMVVINPMPSLSCFQVLRVLDLEGCHSVGRKDKIYLRHLGSVLHLKYLGLNRTHVSELPIEIGNLQILQTLDIRRTYVRELPSSVFQLRKLMRLCINSEIKLPAVSLGNLVSLQELNTLNVDNFSGNELKELGSLTELRFLRIRFYCKLDENQDKALAESISKMQKLQSLEFVGDGCTKFIPVRRVPRPTHHRFDEDLLSTMPSSSLPFLSYVHISVDQVRGDDIVTLGMLPVLRFLYLDARRSKEELAELERGFVLSADGAFPCMTDCTFLGFQTFPCMFPQGTMPMLRSFHFSFLARQISYGFELSMSHLPSIQQVRADVCCRGANVGEVQFAETKFMSAAAHHPNRPTRRINRYLMGRCLERQLAAVRL